MIRPPAPPDRQFATDGSRLEILRGYNLWIKSCERRIAHAAQKSDRKEVQRDVNRFQRRIQ